MTISKNGIVFIALMLLLAFIASKLTVLLLSFFTMAIAFVVVKILIGLLNNESEETIKQTIDRLKTEGMTFTQYNVPDELQALEKTVLRKLVQPSDNHLTLMARFLQQIGVQYPNEIPNYLYLPVIKKMMWEWSRKYGKLTVPLHLKGLLTIDEVLNPIDPKDQMEFHDFCVRHTV